MGLIADTYVDIYSSKKETHAQTYHQPFETFMPSYQLDYAYAPAVMIESPGATGSTVTTKKEAVQTPTQEGIDTTQKDDIDKTTGGNDWILPVAIIGVLAVSGVYLLKGKKK